MFIRLSAIAGFFFRGFFDIDLFARTLAARVREGHTPVKISCEASNVARTAIQAPMAVLFFSNYTSVRTPFRTVYTGGIEAPPPLHARR